LIKLASPHPLFFSPSPCFPVAKCEHCGYVRAHRKWCARCSSVDPFPRRRWILGVAFAAALLAIFAVVLFSSSAIAQRRLIQEISGAKSFRVQK